MTTEAKKSPAIKIDNDVSEKLCQLSAKSGISLKSLASSILRSGIDAIDKAGGIMVRLKDGAIELPPQQPAPRERAPYERFAPGEERAPNPGPTDFREVNIDALPR